MKIQNVFIFKRGGGEVGIHYTAISNLVRQSLFIEIGTAPPPSPTCVQSYT